MEHYQTSNKPTSTISPDMVAAVTEAMHETGINPIGFLELFSVCNPAQALSHFRYILFQALYEKYKGEAEIGSFKNELVEYISMLYELFYETEEEYHKTEERKQNQQILWRAKTVLKNDFSFDETALQKFLSCLGEEV